MAASKGWLPLMEKIQEGSTPVNPFHDSDTQYLKVRGIPWQYALQEGLTSVSDSEIDYHAKRCGFRKGLPCGGILIEYHQCCGGTTYRMRLRETRYVTSAMEGTDVEETVTTWPKFVATGGVPVVPYFPQVITRKVLHDATASLFICEAPLKAISLCYHGFLAIGLGGIEAGFHDVVNKHEQRDLTLHENLRLLTWEKRRVYLGLGRW